MFVQALFAFLALPGVIAFAVPVSWLWASSHTHIVQPLGLLPLLIGVFALLWCVRDFYISGKGTLAPWSPPAHLVSIGLYRYSRNPMYIAVTLILLGWALGFGLPGLFIYAASVALSFHIRVVLGEEPWLAKTYGALWEDYSRSIPRWFW